MENGMDGAECIGELEGEGMGTGFSDDGVQTEILVGKLLGRSGSSEIFGLDENLVADLEVWWSGASGVGGTLITFLSFGDCGPEFLVKVG